MHRIRRGDRCERRPVIPGGPDTFVVIEKWTSMNATRAHAAPPHMAAYEARTREMVASRAIHILAPA